ncbi:hypothetical protein CRENBAI_009493 [Crenichthys baileyi]|uniref:Uncharacterized protein n=1 Tax=Crenichthys baileyi TaxID=28760 RepID=A0AAV9QXH4_9TELE
MTVTLKVGVHSVTGGFANSDPGSVHLSLGQDTSPTLPADKVPYHPGFTLLPICSRSGLLRSPEELLEPYPDSAIKAMVLSLSLFYTTAWSTA